MNADGPDESRLIALASSIDDDQAIDWESAQRQASDDVERDVVSELRVLADVARVARSPDGESTATHSTERATMEIPSEPASQWGSLTILAPLGAGSFGTVYRARDNLNREVALKLFAPRRELRSDQAARVLHEGRLLARVRHPNVVIVHGADRFDGCVGLWMELIRGRTLEQELRARGVLSAAEARLIGLDICSALAAVHAAGLLHRDVKAQNVMREAGGRIVLMDFGAGTDVGVGSSHDDVAGTPSYLAPELFEGSPASPASDIYSLGVLLYHLVTGSYPVEGMNRNEIGQAHRTRRRNWLRDARPDLPERFVRALELALTPDPEHRCQTAGEFEDVLAGSSGSSGDSTHQRPNALPLSEFRRRPIVVTLAASVIIASAVGLWLAWPPHSTSNLDATTLPTPANTDSSPAPVGARADEPYTITAAFYRFAGGDSMRLLPGARVAPGDALGLRIQASTAVYVYVVNEDDRGESYLLFPLPGQAAAAPLHAGQQHDLPGKVLGRETHWQVTSPGGREHFLVFVSPTHLTMFDTLLRTLARPMAGRQVSGARVPEAVMGRLRGVGGLVDRDPKANASDVRPLFEMANPLGPDTETARGLWVRQMSFENPAK